MNKRYKDYNRDCYLRNELLDIISSVFQLKYSRDCGKNFEKFTVYNLSTTAYESYDITQQYTYYLLPLVSELFIVDWKNDFEFKKSFFNLRYRDEKWNLSTSIVVQNIRQESNSIITKEQIFPEIIKYFQLVDPEIGKQLLRNYNLKILV